MCDSCRSIASVRRGEEKSAVAAIDGDAEACMQEKKVEQVGDIGITINYKEASSKDGP